MRGGESRLRKLSAILTTVLVISLLLSTLAVAFNIQPVKASRTVYIRDDGSVDGTDSIQRDGNIYTFIGNINDEIVVEKDDIIVDGAGFAIQGLGGGRGIQMSYRSNVTITNIEIWWFDYAIWLNQCSGITIYSNIIKQNQHAIYLSDHSSNNMISKNTLLDNDFGIEFHESSYSSVCLNRILDAWWGIRLNGSSYNKISGNYVTSTYEKVDCGIYLEAFSQNNIISGNTVDGTISYNCHGGILLHVSSNNKVYGNIIEHCSGSGIGVVGCLNNIISGNSLTKSGNEGINLVDSIDNDFAGNKIANGSLGVRAHLSPLNKFHHNNFINNYEQVDLLYSQNNTWHENYWSDYNGTDSDGDGIGETPYVIDEYNKDYYPLMNPTTYTYYPIPVIVSIDYPDSIKVGEWATITITVENNGRTAEWQTIHCGFPDNLPPENIEIISHDCNGGIQVFPPGASLPSHYGETPNIQSIYSMIECVHGPWENGETHMMTVRVQPESAGTFTFYVKTVNHAEGVTYYDPTSGTKDQQDEYIHVYEINVQSNLMDLIEKYCPYFIFYEQEEYFPTSFYYDDDDVTNNPSNYDKTWPYHLYVHTTEGSWGWSGKEKDYLCIEYWLYYAKDNKFGGWENSLIGAHDHDWESVYVFLKKVGTEYTPDYVAYFHHAWFKDGLIGADLEELYDMCKWIPYSNFPERKDGTHPVVHVADGSHASYWRTIFGWASYKITTILPNIPPDIMDLWIFERCDGGLELCYDDLQIIVIDEPDQDWPDKFGDIQSPWNRTRWDDPGDMLKIIVELGYTTIGMSEYGSKLYMHVYANDKHVGFNKETSEVETEISGSYYEDLGNTTFITLLGNITDFTVTVDGTYAHQATEDYQLVLSTIKENGAIEEVITDTITKGKEKKYAVLINEDGTIESFEEIIPSKDNTPLFLVTTVAIVIALVSVVIVWRRKKAPTSL